MHDPRPPAIALMGPTASGKSALALDWARRLGGEIVSVDSALVYRGLDIGAATPTAEERAEIPHHLVDLPDQRQAYPAAGFAADPRGALAGLPAGDPLPVLAADRNNVITGTAVSGRAELGGARVTTKR